MPVTGWLVTLTESPEKQTAVLSSLAADRRLSVGERNGRWLALVAETTSPAEDEQVLQAVVSMDGVVHCDLVYADFDDAAGALPPLRRRPPAQ